MTKNTTKTTKTTAAQLEKFFAARARKIAKSRAINAAKGITVRQLRLKAKMAKAKLAAKAAKRAA